MSDFDAIDGYTKLTVCDDPMGRRVRLEMSDDIMGECVAMTLNPEQAHDLIQALRHVAQQRIPDDTEDGAGEQADRAYDAYVDDQRGVL